MMRVKINNYNFNNILNPNDSILETKTIFYLMHQINLLSQFARVCSRGEKEQERVSSLSYAGPTF